MSSPVKIDGSLGEGGGQVLRVALTLSTLYSIPIEINNIRAGRAKPGLAAQHLKGVEIVKEMCDAKINGAHIGSTKLEYYPGALNKSRTEFTADTHTAGCISLLAQVALPCALFFPRDNVITLILKGGTNVPMGPHIEYLTEVFKPLLNKFGGDFGFTVVRRGYYPKGGGEVHLYVKPVTNLRGIQMTELGIPQEIQGWAYVAGSVHINAALSMAKDAERTLTENLSKHNISVPPINIEVYREDAKAHVGNGAGINLVCNTGNGCIYGGSGLALARSENDKPGVTAASDIVKPLLTGACVDEHSQDQLIILMAIAQGPTKIRIGSEKLTSHTETAIKVAEIMLGDRGLKFNISKAEFDGVQSYVIECNGCPLINNT